MFRFLFGNHAEEQRAAAEAVRLAAIATQAAAEALAEHAETPAETERNVRRRLEEPSGISLVLLEGSNAHFHRLIQQPWANRSFQDIARELQRQELVSEDLALGSVMDLVYGMQNDFVAIGSIPWPGRSYTMTFFPSSDEEAGSEPDEEMRGGTFAVIRPAGRVLSDEESEPDEETRNRVLAVLRERGQAQGYEVVDRWSPPAGETTVRHALAALRPGGVDLRSPPPGIVPFSGRAYRLD